MKKIFTFLAVATLVAGCSKTDEAIPAPTYTITGYSAADTRTEFGEPDANSIPFLWSVGDKVWAGLVQSEALTSGGPSATFRVQGSAPQNGTKVYYNMMATQAADMTTAVVPTAQDVDNSLGENGDFGYATVSNGEFTLYHATSYLWFDIKALPEGATLKSIRLHAGDAIVAGSKLWQNTQFKPTTDNGRSIIDLAVNKSSVSDEEVLAMVVLPTAIESATVTYELIISGDTKYYEQTLGAKTLAMGTTYKISVNLATVSLKDYVLRTLTFEDNHALFAPYSFTAPASDYMMSQEMETIKVKTWSDLIVDQDKQAYSASFIYGYSDMFETFVDTNYKWGDEGNTNLVQTEFRSNYGYKDFAGGGGYVISKYVGISAATIEAAEDAMYNAAYDYQLSISASNAHGGDNYAIGFHTATPNAPEDQLPMIEFSDGKARIVDHMWVTNTSIAEWAMTYGSNFSDAFDDDDYLIIDAIGYNGANKTGTLSFNMADGSSIVTDWQQWDLSGLGKVTKVLFRMREAQVTSYGYCTPLYLAIDDIAVRFE